MVIFFISAVGTNIYFKWRILMDNKLIKILPKLKNEATSLIDFINSFPAESEAQQNYFKKELYKKLDAFILTVRANVFNEY